MIIETLAVFFSTCLAYLLLQFYLGRRPKQFPPGPLSLPIFGNLFQVGMEPHKGIMKMRKKYGDIISIDMGTRRTIFINEYKLVREIFNLTVANGRIRLGNFAEQETGIFRGNGFIYIALPIAPGLFFSSGPQAIEQRRFVFSYIQSEFRDRNIMEKLIVREVDELIGELHRSSGTSMYTRSVFNLSSINSLWTIVAGRRYSFNDNDFNEMIKHNTIIFDSGVLIGLHIFYPEFSKRWPRLSGYQKIGKEIGAIIDFMKNIIKEHKETYQEGIQRDFVDAYIQKINSTTDSKSSFYGKTGDVNMVHSLFDLFFAGTDTVSATLHWLMFLMAHFPDSQKKLIRAVREFKPEKGQTIVLQDRSSLPYVEAVIQEVLRFSSFLPFGAFHETTADFDFHGYRIPKGTAIAANLYGIMHDPDVWQDPEDFNPGRFLSDDEKQIIRHPAFIPFGAGRRSCPGEFLARDELFLFVTNLFQNFRVEFDPSAPVPSLNSTTTTFLLPVDHKIIFYKHSE